MGFSRPSPRYLHFGLTSSDVVDTALALQLRAAGDLILASFDRLLTIVVRRAREERDTPMIGRTHSVHAEPMTLGAKLAGLDPLIWWNVMKGGAADSFVMSHDVPSIFAGHYDPSFPIALCLKDLSLIKELMDEVGTRNELTAATHARFCEAGERYGQGAGEMTVCKVIEDDAGIDLRVSGD